MGVATAVSTFYYCVVPNNVSVEPTKDVVIKSTSVCELLFLQKMLKFEADIIIGHMDWDIDADTIIDIVEVCRSMEFIQDGKSAFNELMKHFGVNVGLFWSTSAQVRTYRKYFENYYSAYYNKLSAKQKLEPPKAIYYNAFAKTVNEYISISKSHGNIILRISR